MPIPPLKVIQKVLWNVSENPFPQSASPTKFETHLVKKGRDSACSLTRIFCENFQARSYNNTDRTFFNTFGSFCTDIAVFAQILYNPTPSTIFSCLHVFYCLECQSSRLIQVTCSVRTSPINFHSISLFV